MRILTRQVLPGLAAAALLLTGRYAQAQTTNYTYQLVQPDTLAEWSRGFIFPQFDPALGVLESVRITANYGINTSGSISNMDQHSKVVRLQVSSQLSLSLPASLGTLDVPCSAEQVRFRLPGLSWADYGPYSVNSSVQLTFSGADLAPFLGTGTLGLLGQTATQESVTGGGAGQIATLLATTGSATITLEYFDMAVPEPSPAALFTLGGLVFLRKRQKN